MKRFTLFALAVLACSGCAATAVPQGDSDLDFAVISAVENQARLHGVRVIWVNAPRKMAASGT